MICFNCKKEIANKSKFCEYCGFNIAMKEGTKSQISVGKKTRLKKKTPPKKKSGCFFVFLFLIILLVSPFLYQVLKDSAHKIRLEKQIKKMELTSYEKIREDYALGKIDVDTYIKESAFSLFNPKQMNKQYHSSKKIQLAPPIFELAEEHFDELSEETKKLLYHNLMMTDIRIGKKEIGDNKTGYHPFIDTVYAKETTSEMSARTLDKAMLSPNQKFLIYYTEEGDNAVSTKLVEQLGQKLENTLIEIEAVTGIPYQFSSTYAPYADDDIRVFKAKLKGLGIDPSYMTSALPVYLVNKSDDSLAYYMKKLDNQEKLIVGLAEMIDGNIFRGIPTFPYVVLKPNAIKDNPRDLDVIITHELAHHFQYLYCGTGCDGDDFTIETSANWIAGNAKNPQKTDTVLNYHVDHYLMQTDKMINKINNGSGYPNLTFLKVYEDLVNDGKRKILDSMDKKDALIYLYQQSEGSFSTVMTTLAFKNINDDFESNVFKGSAKANSRGYPYALKELCNSYCKYDQKIDPTAIHYYRFDHKMWKKNLTFQFSKTGQNNHLTLLVIGKRNREFVKLKQYNLASPVTLDGNELESYDEIIFAIVNSTIEQVENYEIGVVHNRLLTLFAGTVSPEEIESIENVMRQKGECTEIYFDDFFNLIGNFTNMVNRFFEMMKENMDSQTAAVSFEQYVQSLNQFERDSNLGKQALKEANLKKMKICPLPVSTTNYPLLHKQATKVLEGLKFKVYDVEETPDRRMSMGIGLNVLTRKAKIYSLSTGSEGALFYLIEFE